MRALFFTKTLVKTEGPKAVDNLIILTQMTEQKSESGDSSKLQYTPNGNIRLFALADAHFKSKAPPLASSPSVSHPPANIQFHKSGPELSEFEDHVSHYVYNNEQEA